MSLRITLFTIDEATELARQLRPELDRLAALKAELSQLEIRSGVLRLTVTAGGSSKSPEARELRDTQAKRVRVAGEIAAGVDAIHAQGCLLKDLERGLIDFYALTGDRLVFLCWKRDEPEVTHWHTLEAGFAGRRPLDASELG
ncbi:MAG: DUF2203 domain-containing protein [Candidatus Eisenbacteria bacterium]